MFMADTLTLDAPRRDSSGNMVASVLAARTGCQDYAGFEVGKPELAKVTVYRPAEEVFSRDSMRSFAGAPVTIEHPREVVTPANWKDHAVGEASEEIVRDGEAVRVPFLLRDAAGIQAVEAGKREISMGYDCSLSFEDGTAPDGTPYQAVQRNIRINHLAIVDRARGGPTLRIGDQEKKMKITIGDAKDVDLSDGAAVALAVGALNTSLADAKTRASKAETDLAAVQTSVAAKDTEIAGLKQQVADATLTPAKLRDAAKAYAIVCDKARSLGVTFAEDADADAIMKSTVDAKMGDAAKDWNAEQIAASFAVLTKDAKPSAATFDSSAFTGGFHTTTDAATDYQADRNKRLASVSGAWRTPFTAADAAATA